MQAHKEQWQHLCEQIAIEQDPERFLSLVQELNDLLEAKERRLDAQRKDRSAQAGGSGVKPTASNGPRG